MLNLSAASSRLIQALKNKERILIHGDYDADGVTSAALLFRFLKEIGCLVEVHIPNRLTESHGLSENLLDIVKEKSIGLVLTCDCGIGSADIIETA